MVILGTSTLTFVYLDKHTGLVVRIGSKNLLLLRRDCRIPLNDLRHDTTGSLEPERNWSNIQEQKILDVVIVNTRKNGSLDRSTIGNGFIGVDRFVELLTIEETREHLLNLRNSRRTTNQNNFINLSLVHLRITDNLFDRFHTLSEEVSIQILETSSSDR